MLQMMFIPSRPNNASALACAANQAGRALSTNSLPPLVRATGLLRPFAPFRTSAINPAEAIAFRSRVSVDLFKC